MKQKLERQIFKNLLLFFIYIFTTELIVRFSVKSSLLSYATLRIFISSLILSLVISLIMTITKKHKKVLATIFSFIIMIYAWVEVNLYFYLGFFMGMGNAEQGTKVIDYFKEFLGSSKPVTYLMIILFILLMSYYWFFDNFFKQRKLERTTMFTFKIESIKRKILVYIGSFIALVLLSISYYGTIISKKMHSDLQTISNTNLLLNPENSNLSVSQFGVFVYGISDVFSNTFKLEATYEFNYKADNDKTTMVNDYTRYIDDRAFISLLENENNKTYSNLNNYFLSREITPKNEYTGMFEDKNLIFILMESIGEVIINEELFPNFYKLYTEGMNFTNNYSPRNSCATGNNELASMTSLYTVNNTCTANTYKKNIYPHSIFNHFNNLGYATSSYHNYIEAYYSRRVIHKNLGSSIYRNASDLGIRWSGLYEEWPSDVDLIETAVPHFINEDKFFAYLTTVTTHQPFGVKSEYGDKSLDRLDGYDYDITMKRYLSKMFELDDALGLLLNNLEDTGKLDDTVIVLVGDHYPYGLADKHLSSYLGYDVSINNEVDRTPLIIYNSLNEPKQIDKYTSIVDILPTILNLFNIKYDPRLYFGNDIFSKYSDRVVFADGSWQNKYGFYDGTKMKFTPVNPEEGYSNQELININRDINLKQTYSALAIKNNYYDYLYKGLEKYKVVDEIIEDDISEE